MEEETDTENLEDCIFHNSGYILDEIEPGHLEVRKRMYFKDLDDEQRYSLYSIVSVITNRYITEEILRSTDLREDDLSLFLFMQVFPEVLDNAEYYGNNFRVGTKISIKYEITDYRIRFSIKDSKEKPFFFSKVFRSERLNQGVVEESLKAKDSRVYKVERRDKGPEILNGGNGTWMIDRYSNAVTFSLTGDEITCTILFDKEHPKTVYKNEYFVVTSEKGKYLKLSKTDAYKGPEQGVNTKAYRDVLNEIRQYIIGKLPDVYRGEEGEQISDIEYIIGELVTNAEEHGNKQLPGKDVYISYFYKNNVLTLTASDQKGEEFDFSEKFEQVKKLKELADKGEVSVLDLHLGQDPVRGRGLLSLKSYVDLIQYSDDGKRLIVAKKLEPYPEN